jgi:hypothetical protein
VSPEAKRGLSALAADRFYDLSAIELPSEEPDALRKILSLFHPLRSVIDREDQHKVS